MTSCVCGLHLDCPAHATSLASCPIWAAHVRPSLWERIVGTIVAFLMPWRRS
jgi:hypothetical protein